MLCVITRKVQHEFMQNIFQVLKFVDINFVFMRCGLNFTKKKYIIPNQNNGKNIFFNLKDSSLF